MDDRLGGRTRYSRLLMAYKDQTELVLSAQCAENTPLTWVLDAPGRDTFRIIVRCRGTQSPDEAGKAPGLPIPGDKDAGSLQSGREPFGRFYEWNVLFRRKQLAGIIRNTFKHSR